MNITSCKAIIALINAWLGTGIFRINDPIKYCPFWRRPKDSAESKN